MRSFTDHQAFVRQLQLQLLNTKLLKSRRGLGNHVMISELCGDESNANQNCQSLDIFDCISSISMKNCHRLNQTEYEIDSSFHNQLIVMEFMHNFTNILNGSVYFVHSLDNGQSRKRTIEVRFRQIAESQTPHHSVSGNLGYKLGKPVIVSHWTRANESDEHSQMIANYFHVNNSQHDNEHQFLRIPSFTQNECKLNNITYETIDFGHDLFLKCEIQLDKNLTGPTPTATNLTLLCQQFQTTIFRFILNGTDHQSDTIVSSLGNPKNVSTQWIRLARDSNQEFSDIKGVPDEGGFRCLNIMLGVGYEFEVSRLRVNGQPHQNVIKAAKLRMMDTRVDLKFGWDEDLWKVPASVDVVFLDMTRKSEV